MSSLWGAPAAAAILIGWLLAPPETIGQVASREEFRRQLVGRSTRLYTNYDLPVQAIVSEIDAPAPTPDPVSVLPRDEAWWRTRIATARAMLDRNQILADGLAMRVSSLTREIVNQVDTGEQARLRAQLKKTMDELDRQQKIVLGDRRTVEAIQEDARRLGIPMGWLR
ncbi:MAG TPA: hypothetical protein VFV98_02615 [Vicinamibacterales bacterium]|nr:hypothetical protein [Vicinamibacterales bacterium]